MRLRGAVVGAAVLALAGACSSGDSDAAPPAAAATTSAAPAEGDADPTGPTPTPTPALPPGCETLLPFTDLDQALGRPLFGETRQVTGVAQASIGRTGRLTCYFGLAKDGRGKAPVEVGVSTYRDADSATKRVAATVAGARAGGATSQSQATVAGQPATVLGDAAGFTAVVAQGDRTIAVTVLRSLKGRPDRAAVAIAEKVVANWTR